MSKAIKFLRQLVIKNYNNLLGISLTLYILKINKKRKEKKKQCPAFLPQALLSKSVHF